MPSETMKHSVDESTKRQIWIPCSFEDVRKSLAVSTLSLHEKTIESTRNLMLDLVSAIGELCECFQWRKCDSNLTEFSREDRLHVGKVLCDIFCNIVKLAERCDIVLPKAMNAKIGLNAKKYPVSLVRGQSYRYTHYANVTGFHPHAEQCTNQGGKLNDSTDWTGYTLEDMRIKLFEFVTDRDWMTFHSPRNLCLALCGELGELCSCFSSKSDEECSVGLEKWTEKEKDHLAQEISDVAIYLVRLSDECGIDLGCEFLRKTNFSEESNGPNLHQLNGQDKLGISSSESSKIFNHLDTDKSSLECTQNDLNLLNDHSVDINKPVLYEGITMAQDNLDSSPENEHPRVEKSSKNCEVRRKILVGLKSSGKEWGLSILALLVAFFAGRIFS